LSLRKKIFAEALSFYILIYNIPILLMKIYCEAYLKAFSLGGRIWQYNKIFSEEQLLQIHERIVRKFESK